MSGISEWIVAGELSHLGERSCESINSLDFFRICNTDTFGSDANQRSILLVQSSKREFETAVIDIQKPP